MIMFSQMKFQKSEQKENYKLCYIEKMPLTLTITKMPEKIVSSLYQLTEYIWMMTDTQKIEELKQLFKNEMKENLICYEEVMQAKKELKKFFQGIIICELSLIKQVNICLEQNIKAGQIKQIIYYGKQKTQNVIGEHVSSEQQALQLLKKNKMKFRKAKQFINYISIDKQVWESNHLLKIMFAMINQNTCRKYLIQQFQKLAKLYHPCDQIQEFVGLYKKNFYLTEAAIEWYTKDCFLHGLVNGILRLNKDPTSLFIIQPYFQDLFKAISQLYQTQQKDKPINYKAFTCYRGCQISLKQFKFFNKNKGSLIQNLGFLSTSILKEKAEGFITNAFFQIQVNNEIRLSEFDFGFGFVEQFSQQKFEKQVIFNPLNTFKIVQVGHYDTTKNIYKIKLRYGEMARLMAIDRKDLNQKQRYYKYLGEYQLQQSKNCRCIGQVLVKFNQNPEGSEVYCEKFWEIANKSYDQIDILNAHLIRGIRYKNLKRYQDTDREFLKCLEIIQRKKSKFSILYSNILNNLSINQMTSNNYSSYIYLQECLDIRRKILSQKHPAYAALLNNLAIQYFRDCNYIRAADFFLKCRQIQKINNDRYHPDYARVLGNQGIFHYFYDQYKFALKNFEECQQIQLMIIGENHPDYVNTIINLVNTYKKIKGSEQQVQFYKQKYEELVGEQFPDNKQPQMHPIIEPVNFVPNTQIDTLGYLYTFMQLNLSVDQINTITHVFQYDCQQFCSHVEAGEIEQAQNQIIKLEQEINNCKQLYKQENGLLLEAVEQLMKIMKILIDMIYDRLQTSKQFQICQQKIVKILEIQGKKVRLNYFDI